MKKIILISILFCSSCIYDKQKKLIEETSVTNHFDIREINYLNKIVCSFDSFILKKTETKNIDLAYTEFSQKLKNVESSNNLLEIFNQSKDFEYLTNNLIKDSLFNCIWKFEYGYNYKSKDTISISIVPNNQKYTLLLESVGKNNEFIESYVNSMTSIAGISPSLVAGFLAYSCHTNYNCEVNRLIFAIHYLTINSEKKFHSRNSFARAAK